MDAARPTATGRRMADSMLPITFCSTSTSTAIRGPASERATRRAGPRSWQSCSTSRRGSGRGAPRRPAARATDNAARSHGIADAVPARSAWALASDPERRQNVRMNTRSNVDVVGETAVLAVGPDHPYLAEIELERESWTELIAICRSLEPEERLLPGYYRNPDWSVKDMVAHLVTWLAEAGIHLFRIDPRPY